MKRARRMWIEGLGVGVACGLVIVAWAGRGSDRAAEAWSPPPDATYLGEAQCKRCHLKQHKTWGKTKHAETWNLLPEADRKDDAKDDSGKACVSCHITGYGMPGGPANMEEGLKRALGGTQCEACHGPGSVHVDLAKKSEGAEKAPDEVLKAIDRVPQNTCIRCHNPHLNHEKYKKT